MDLELTFKDSIEITDNFQYSGNESGSIQKYTRDDSLSKAIVGK